MAEAVALLKKMNGKGPNNAEMAAEVEVVTAGKFVLPTHLYEIGLA